MCHNYKYFAISMVPFGNQLGLLLSGPCVLDFQEEFWLLGQSWLPISCPVIRVCVPWIFNHFLIRKYPRGSHLPELDRPGPRILGIHLEPPISKHGPASSRNLWETWLLSLHPGPSESKLGAWPSNLCCKKPLMGFWSSSLRISGLSSCIFCI